jgi:very-short-patch-repair endonuclease
MAGKLRHARLGWGIAELADRQHGVIGREQLVEVGVPVRTIERWVDGGRLHRVHREVFAVGYPRIGEAGRRWAAVLAYGEGALLSHRSAAALWGLSRQRPELIDVTAPMGRQGVRRRDGIFIHRGRLYREDRVARGGLPVTTVARTLFDLAEFVTLKRLESAWEEADRLNLLYLREVEAVCERGYGRRALRPIRALLAEARAVEITRSPLEDDFAAFCRMHRLPPPVFNTTVLDYEVDALWPRQKVAVELDSWSFHGHRAAFERDRARDTVLQVAGYRTLRITHRRLHNESAIVLNQLRALLGSNAALSQPQSGSG